MEQTSEFSKQIEALLAEGDTAIAETRAYLISRGQAVDFSEWVTIEEYCKRFNIKNIAIVINWIKRGIVPKENVVTIEELNNAIVIKAIPYQVETAKIS